MANIYKHGKTTRVQFNVGGKRRTLYLGDVSVKKAKQYAYHVQNLVESQTDGSSVPSDTQGWLAELTDKMREKLSNCGLDVVRYRTTTLGGFLDEYVASRTDVADNTRRNYQVTVDKLNEQLGADRSIRSITPGDADDFESWIRTKNAKATANRDIKRAKQFFIAAKRKGYIDRNPFAHIKGGASENEERKEFITRETIDTVLKHCPDIEWQVIVALARFGGLRVPSELRTLRWGHVVWDERRLVVIDSKTKKERITPLWPELVPYLETAFDSAEPGTEFVVPTYRSRANLATRFRKIITRAGCEPWSRLWHNLRASRQTELENDFPTHVVCKWLGNSPGVANRHYLQVTDEHFSRALNAAPERNVKCNVTKRQQRDTTGVQSTPKHEKTR